MSLIVELKRRRVFKVGAAYVVVAWLAVQAASIAFPAFDAPPWVMRTFILLAALGFPLTVVLAWVFDITPEGVKLETAPVGNKRVFAIAAGCAALALAWYFVGRPALQGSAANARSIAVLPFVNMSADPAQEFFSDGIAEELLNQLAQFPDLSVAARTSAFQFKGKNLDVAEIGRKLNVAHVLEGSVRKEGTRLRITAQLIQVASGFHLWSQTFERDASDVFKVQDEISTAIAKALEARLSGRAGPDAAARIVDPAAYDDYLLARSLVARRTGENLPLAIQAFDRAVARDPSYAPALSGRAFAYAIAPGWSGTISIDDATPKALADIEAALKLEPDNAEAYLVRGTIHSFRFEENAARKDLDRALALAPGNVDVLNFVGDDYQYSGNLRAAERMKRQAIALDPLAFVHPANLAGILSAQGRFTEALVQARRAVDLGGGPFARREMLWPQLRLGDLDAARATVAAICTDGRGDQHICLQTQVALYAVAGERADFAAASAKLDAATSSDGMVFPSDVASVYANFAGDMTRANAAMRRLLARVDYNGTVVLLLGPKGARLPEEISQDPDWLANWNDPQLAELMSAYRANLAAFRKGG